jgi:hypothetical protein
MNINREICGEKGEKAVPTRKSEEKSDASDPSS